MSLPQSLLETFLLPSLLEHWLDLDLLFCEVLNTLVTGVTNQTDHKLDEHFVWLWRFLAHGILNSEPVTHTSVHLFQTDLLSMLLLSEIHFLLDTHTSLLFKRLIDVFEAWVTKLGQSVNGFKILVQFLQNNGSDYLADRGISWLFNSWEQLDSQQSILGDTQMVSKLSRLLHDIWYTLPESQKEQLDFLEHFVRIVDECAAGGNLLAVELQRKVHAL